MIQIIGGSSHIKNKDHNSFSWRASNEGMVEPVKAENTDCGVNGPCFKPWFWIHHNPRTSLGH